MVVLTLLLGGLVALNVAALRSTITVSDVNSKVQHLRQQNMLDQARVGRLSSVPRITRKAESYGMRQSAPPEADHFSIGSPNPITPSAPAASNPG